MSELLNLFLEDIECNTFVYLITRCIVYFTIPNITTTIRIGWGCTYEDDQEWIEKMTIDTLTDASGNYYDGVDDYGQRLILSDEQCSKLEGFFDNKVSITRVGYPGNYNVDKGYGSYSVYTLKAKENDVVTKAKQLLASIHELIESKELYNRAFAIHKQKKDEENAIHKKDDTEYKERKAAHHIYYSKLLTRSKEFVIPKKKKDAIIVPRDDFAALSLAVKFISQRDHFNRYDNYFVTTLEDNFNEENIKVWMPTHFHCEGVNSKIHISIHKGHKVIHH
jgi:hypothetical protein